MNEKSVIETIKSVIGTGYIGDDCAYLKDLGIVVSQDSLVEDVHFKTDWITPFQLGYKSIMVNISDICASGAKPLYLTVSLSLPSDTSEDFVKKFYEGATVSSIKTGTQIVGGDTTGGDKIFISVTAIGSTADRRISSRANARAGQKIIVSGEHGSSAAGLIMLERLKGSGVERDANYRHFIDAHLMPEAQCAFSRQVAEQIGEDYAMMDTSDGLMDALWAIADASQSEHGVVMSVDFDKIPYRRDLEQFNNFKDLVLYGGEDYQLVAAVPESLLPKLDNYWVIGEVKSGKSGVELDGEHFTREDAEGKLYDHFGG